MKRLPDDKRAYVALMNRENFPALCRAMTWPVVTIVSELLQSVLRHCLIQTESNYLSSFMVEFIILPVMNTAVCNLTMTILNRCKSKHHRRYLPS